MALFPEVEGVVEFAFFPYGWERVSNAISTPFDSGHKAVRPRYSEQPRRGQLTCRNLPKLSKERITAFIREIKGGGNVFQIIDRVNAIVPPYFAPALDNVTAGSKSSRTYYVVTTHSNADRSKETTASEEDSLLVPANDLLTVKMPDLPPGVVRSNVYIGTAAGVVYYSGSTLVSLDLWTESYGSTNVNNDSGVGTDILFVISTANMQVGDAIRINASGPREEWQIIKALLAGPVRIQIEGTLAYTHTLGDADAVAVVIGDSNMGAPPTDNNFFNEEINVALMNEWKPVLTSPGVWAGTLDLEEELP